ncbi:MAG: DUF4387 domain-containing protein [Candidatus Bipolaricaulota bacterium]
MRIARLEDLAKVIRSKNAGPFELTLDVMFDSAEVYDQVKNSGVITRQAIAKLYGYEMDPDRVLAVAFFDPALAVKITLVRPCVSGALGDCDVYGAQQHAPLLGLEIPVRDPST